MKKYTAVGLIVGGAIGLLGGELLHQSAIQDVDRDLRTLERCRGGDITPVETEVTGRFACNGVMVDAVLYDGLPTFYWDSAERALELKRAEVSDSISQHMYDALGIMAGAGLGGFMGLTAEGIGRVIRSQRETTRSERISSSISPAPE